MLRAMEPLRIRTDQGPDGRWMASVDALAGARAEGETEQAAFSGLYWKLYRSLKESDARTAAWRGPTMQGVWRVTSALVILVIVLTALSIIVPVSLAVRAAVMGPIFLGHVIYLVVIARRTRAAQAASDAERSLQQRLLECLGHESTRLLALAHAAPARAPEAPTTAGQTTVHLAVDSLTLERAARTLKALANVTRQVAASSGADRSGSSLSIGSVQRG